MVEPQIILDQMLEDWKCYFCQAKKPKNVMALRYYDQNGNNIINTCMWHKSCDKFVLTGKLCQNHEEKLDVKCGEVPF